MRPARVLLADDHPLFLTALRQLLETQCEVVGAVCDGRALVEAAASSHGGKPMNLAALNSALEAWTTQIQTLATQVKLLLH